MPSILTKYALFAACLCAGILPGGQMPYAADATNRPAKTHWAYVKPVQPELPHVRNARWERNAIDVFVLARLEKENLKPSPEADRVTLIRRLSLDLTG